MPLVPGGCVRRDFEATGVPDEFIQDANYLLKLRPIVPLFLPAVQHQLVEGGRAVHGWWQAVTFIYSFYYLHLGTDRKDRINIHNKISCGNYFFLLSWVLCAHKNPSFLSLLSLNLISHLNQQNLLILSIPVEFVKHANMLSLQLWMSPY